MAIIQDSVDNVVKRMNRSDVDINASAVTWLVQAYTDIASRYPFVEFQRYFNRATVQGQREYPLPDGVRAVLAVTLQDTSITNSNGTPLTRRLKKTSFREIVKANFNVASAPYRYARWNDKLFADPIPDRSTYNIIIYAWVYPATSALENTTVMLPPEWIEVMEWEAVWRGHNEQLDYDAARHVMEKVIVPMTTLRYRNLKSYIELQDWDVPVAQLVQRSTPAK